MLAKLRCGHNSEEQLWSWVYFPCYCGERRGIGECQREIGEAASQAKSQSDHKGWRIRSGQGFVRLRTSFAAQLRLKGTGIVLDIEVLGVHDRFHA